MPYNLPEGMDNEKNNQKIKRCVKKLQDKGRSKESAIRICKASIIQAAKAREQKQ